MNSLPLMTEIIRPGEVSTLISFNVLPVADFCNTMYWHDAKDKSLISVGSVKISRVYHCTYASFMKRISADETALLHYDGTYVINDQIVTVIEFVAQIGFSFETKEEKKPSRQESITIMPAWKAVNAALAKVNLSNIVFRSCDDCAYFSHGGALKIQCFSCANRSNKPAARPEPENIDETPTEIERRCETCCHLMTSSGSVGESVYDCGCFERPLICIMRDFNYWEPKK